jgi:hypothetical protein
MTDDEIAEMRERARANYDPAVKVLAHDALRLCDEVTRLRALMAGRSERPTIEEFDALGAIGGRFRVRWDGGDDEIPARDPYWVAVAITPDGARWWATDSAGAIIEWPRAESLR